MIPDDPYRWLMAADGGPKRDAFDAHVVASILTLAIIEVRKSGGSVLEGLGLNGSNLIQLANGIFPHAAPVLAKLADAAPPEIEDEEICLRDLLERCSTAGSRFETQLAAMIARRALRPNHLWQDLGLRERRELSQLMARHFEPLARRNVRDMKWKKFLYRTICRDEGYTLCTAPSCSECDDFAECFGEETGESLLAAVRRAAEISL